MTLTQRWTLVATIVASGVVFLDSTVVNVALPRIGQELKSNLFGVLEAQSYVYNGYLLTLSSLLILAGALSDYYGRKRVYVIGLWGFGLTSAMCGLASNLDWLILARVLQGVAGALLIPGSLAIIGSSFSKDQQGRAFGIWSSASAGMTLLGPLVGGSLVDGAGWRIAFLINLPVILLALWALRHVPESRNQNASSHFDWMGALVIAVGVGGLAYGAIRGQEQNWRDFSAFVALALGMTALLIFPLSMRRAQNPLIPLGLFASRTFLTLNLSTFLIYGALYVSSYYQGLFVQGILGYTALAAGLLGLPTGVLLALLSVRVGMLSSRYGLRIFLVAGPLLMALGTAWLMRIPSSSGAWRASLGEPSSLLPPAAYWLDIFPATILFGLGLALLVAPLTSGIMASVPAEQTGIGSAINNAVSRVGPQLAGALIFVLLTQNYFGNLAQRTGLDTNQTSVRTELAPLNKPASNRPPAQQAAALEASTSAFHLAMGLCAGLLVLGGMVNAWGLRESTPEDSKTNQVDS